MPGWLAHASIWENSPKHAPTSPTLTAKNNPSLPTIRDTLPSSCSLRVNGSSRPARRSERGPSAHALPGTAWKMCSREPPRAVAQVHGRTHTSPGISAKGVGYFLEGGGMLLNWPRGPQIATISADAGDSGDALPHLQRCRNRDAGENWRGSGPRRARRGGFCRGAGEYSTAEAKLKRSRPSNTIACGGRGRHPSILGPRTARIRSAGSRHRKVRCRDRIFTVTGPARVIEYVLADKMRAQGSKSTQADDQVPLTDSIHGVAAAVAQERADLARHAAPDGPSAFCSPISKIRPRCSKS